MEAFNWLDSELENYLLMKKWRTTMVQLYEIIAASTNYNEIDNLTHIAIIEHRCLSLSLYLLLRSQMPYFKFRGVIQ